MKSMWIKISGKYLSEQAGNKVKQKEKYDQGNFLNQADE